MEFHSSVVGLSAGFMRVGERIQLIVGYATRLKEITLLAPIGPIVTASRKSTFLRSRVLLRQYRELER
jgi:hypothetical protein